MPDCTDPGLRRLARDLCRCAKHHGQSEVFIMRVRVDQAPFVPEWYQNGHFDPAKRTKELSKQLKLTADQQSQMLDTLESTKSQLEAVRSDRSLSRKVRNCKLALIRQASNDQINAFLEKKQNTTFFRIRAAYAARSSASLW